MKRFLFLPSVIFLISCAPDQIYYVDSVNCNDTNSGHRPQEAWASLDKINATTFKPGDQILFKAGTSYQGQLELLGSGNAEAPIIVDKYGTGSKPAIHGNGEKLHTVMLRNIEYWEIRNP
ncbi:MAG: hypothetical protein O2887_05695 [Bacteroidetes bacterium]|nr:hypothetical protein [Bacteroidota bacterium]MDA1119975.1 hypothetical protein [Bacteroidota bacterium]